MGIVEVKEIISSNTDQNWTRWRFQNEGILDGITNRSNWIKIGYSGNEVDTYTTEMKKLEALCLENELLLYGTTRDYFLDDYSGSFFFEFYLCDVLPDQTTMSNNGRNPFGTNFPLGVRNVICSDCRYENSCFDLYCSGCSSSLECQNCGMNPQSFLTTRITNEETREFVLHHDQGYCNSCSSICSSCEEPWLPLAFSENSSYTECRDCQPRFNCRNCGELEIGEIPVNGYCNRCNEDVCEDCNNFLGDEERFVEEEGRRICSRCFNALDKNIEVFDDDSEMPATRLALPTIEGRERIRFCGLEIEGVNIHPEGHNILAQDFYDLNLSGFNTRRSYHERHDSGFVHVERDSSCDWEAVIGPINMAANRDVRNLNTVIKQIRTRIKDKTLKLSLNCGLHIHVSAEKVGIKQAHNLHLLYTYLEDIMYRLGAAKWPMHRAVVNGDHSYQLSPRSVNKINFINNYMENRYHGLSFSNYFQKMMNHCGCGAGRFGLFEECECSLSKCTFEFRIFNTTANTRKIHAYTALTQALVAKALSMTEFDLEKMPASVFNLRNFKDMHSSHQELLEDEWFPRMKFILEELPLTNEEKESILYCVENSEMGSIIEFCKELMGVEVEA